MTKPDYTHLLLIVDRSGSMETIKKDMNGGIASLLKDQAKVPGQLNVAAYTFDDKVEHIGTNLKANDRKLKSLVVPRGMTALYDAVGIAVTDLGKQFELTDEDERPDKVIVVIVTDGGENSSRDWTQAGVKQLLEQQQNVYKWEVVFLGANIDVPEVAQGIGLRASASSAYDPTSAGVRSAFATTSGLLAGYRTGATSSINYTDPDES